MELDLETIESGIEHWTMAKERAEGIIARADANLGILLATKARLLGQVATVTQLYPRPTEEMPPDDAA